MECKGVDARTALLAQSIERGPSVKVNTRRIAATTCPGALLSLRDSLLRVKVSEGACAQPRFLLERDLQIAYLLA